MKRILCLLLGVILILCFASPSLAAKCRPEDYDFDAEIIIDPDPVCIGQDVTISATITNTGNCTDSYKIVGKIVLDLPGMKKILVGKVTIKLEPGESKTCSITQEIPSTVPPDTYTAEIVVKSVRGGRTETFTPSLTVQNCCTDNSDCGAGEYCEKAVGDCDGEGVCIPLPVNGACPGVWDPVCGCNGVTYSNNCIATMAGVSIDYYGECVGLGAR